MKTLSPTLKAVTFALFIMALSAAAHAQASRTWVSGVGDDAMPCSRTAPCKTWAGAISKTAAGGEIDALDPGGFGTVAINKSITIDGATGAGWGSSLNSGTTVNGFTIDDSQTTARNTSMVKLRNISINGGGAALGGNGIKFTSGAQLHVENCRIMNQSGNGIRLDHTFPARLIVQDTTISDCGGGGIEVSGAPTAGNHAVVVTNVKITRCLHGFRVTGKCSATIFNSVISLNNATTTSKGVDAGSQTSSGSIIDLINSDVSYNSIGVTATQNQFVRLSGVHMTGNGNALNFAGGTIATLKNNTIVGNVGGENFTLLTNVNQQ